jgi:hypothetical protein
MFRALEEISQARVSAGFPARSHQAAIVENKRLGPVSAYIAERQKAFDLSRSKAAPRRRGQAERHMFKVG